MRLDYHAIIPIPSMPSVCERYGIAPVTLVRVIIDSLEGNDYHVMRCIQELPCVSDPDMFQCVMDVVDRVVAEFLDQLPDVGLGRHIRDISLITAHLLTAHIRFAVCDDE